MKKVRILSGVLLLVLAIIAFSTVMKKDEDCMSVIFSGSGTQNIKWTNPTNAVGMNKSSFSLKVNLTSFATGYDVFLIYDDGTLDADEFLEVLVLSSGKVKIITHFSTANGAWETTNAVLSLSTKTHIGITYDGSSTANNPIIYINGVSKPVTKTASPSGTYQAGTTTNIYVGSDLADNNPVGEVEDVRRYNVIKSAAQMAVIANEDIKTNATIDESGLVFHAPLVMCKGLTYPTFVNSTLGTANTFFDRINGYLGVPSGSPVGG